MLYCQSKEESAANQCVALPSSGIIEVVLECLRMGARLLDVIADYVMATFSKERVNASFISNSIPYFLATFNSSL